MSPKKRRAPKPRLPDPSRVGDQAERNPFAHNDEGSGAARFLELAIRSGRVGLWDWDLTTNKVFFSSEWKRQLGLEDEEMSNDLSEWESRVYPGDLERVRESVGDYLRRPDSPFEVEFRMRHHDGSYRWLLAQAAVLTDSDGKPLRFLGSHIDITDRKVAEEALRSSEARFALAFYASPVGLTMTNISDGTFVLVNDAFLKMFEFSRSEVIGHSSLELNIISAEDRARLMQQVAESGAVINVEVALRTRSGRELSLLFSSNPITHDGNACVISTLIDITARKQSESLVRLQSSALNAAANAIVITGRDGEIQWINRAYTELTGYTESDAIGKNPRILKSGFQDRAFYERLWGTILAGGTWRGEVINRRKDGSLYTEEETITPVTDASGAIAHFIGIKQDITARKEADAHIQRQLQQLQSLRTIDLAISSALDLRVTLKVVVGEVTARLGVDATRILLYEPSTAMLEFAAGQGFRTQDFQRTLMHLGEGHAGRTALDRRTLHIPDLRKRAAASAEAPFERAEEFVGYAGVPLVSKGRIMGVLEVFQRSRLEPAADWMNFLETLAGQAAIAIDDATMVADLQRSNTEMLVAYDNTIVGWSHAMDLRDKETEGHTQRVTELTIMMARAAGMSDEAIVHVRRGALLHDMGKLGVPDAILLKTEELTPEEWRVMREHPRHAFEMLSPIPYLRPALDIPYCHHEKWDGSGYPRGLRGEQIPLAARLFSVVDVWDALRSDRPYRAGWSEEQVLTHIRELAGTHFDPWAVELLLQVLREQGESPDSERG